MKRFRIGIILKIVIAILAIILFWVFVIGISAGRPGSFYNKGVNAVWIGHEWVAENKAEKDVFELTNKLEKYQIGTVFVHVGPLGTNGKIDPKTYGYSLSFLEKARRFDNGIKYQAWIGQIRGKLDLRNETVRHNIATQAMVLANLIGFDGVHFDIEPVWDGDLDFIKTLEESRKVLDLGKSISVALAEFIPQSVIWLTKNIHEFKNYNSEVIYNNVGKYADQIVVMAYDTGINRSWIYKWLLKEETIWLTNLLKNKTLYIGIPAYEKASEAFNPKVENIENGLTGIIDGLNNFRSKEANFAGVAIYPYWEMSDEEWNTYENLWLK